MGWSADGTRLLFSSDRGGTAALWAQRVSQGKPEGVPERIKSDIGHRALGLSAAGHLYVGAQVGTRNIHVATMDFRSGTLVGGPELASQRFVGLNEWPDWSPDGKSLSYVSARNWIGRNAVLVIQSVASGSVREFPMTLQNSRNPLWAPDSKSLVAQGIEAQGRRGLYSIDAETGEARVIVHNPEGSFYSHPQYSRDGRKIYFSDRRGPDDAVGVVERDLASGTQRELLRRAGLGHVAVSPDGRYLTTLEGNRAQKYSALLVIDIASGETREVLRTHHPEVLVGWLSWSPDSRHVMLPKFGGSTPRALLLVALEGGPPRKVDLPGYAWGRIRVHPDGKRVAYLAGNLKAEVWVLENFLPAK
jgi:Tol biopolymer transport system component